MPEVVEYDPFDPKKIYDDLIKRAKQAKAWYLYCYVDEAWVPKKVLPFELEIINGVFCCRVVTNTFTEAQKIIANNLPVIKFIDEPDYDSGTDAS